MVTITVTGYGYRYSYGYVENFNTVIDIAIITFTSTV